MYVKKSIKMVKLLAGATYIGLDPFAIISTLRVGGATKTAKKLREYLNVSYDQLNHLLSISLTDLMFIFKNVSNNDVTWRFKSMAKKIFLNKEILKNQPLYIRWRFNT